MKMRRCLFCFAEHACELRFTKKGLPYVTCRICYTRAFFNSMDALRGVSIMPDLIDTTLQQVADGKADWVRKKTAEMNAYVRDRMTGRGLPEPSEAPTPYVDVVDEKKEAV